MNPTFRSKLDVWQFKIDKWGRILEVRWYMELDVTTTWNLQQYCYKGWVWCVKYIEKNLKVSNRGLMKGLQQNITLQRHFTIWMEVEQILKLRYFSWLAGNNCEFIEVTDHSTTEIYVKTDERLHAAPNNSIWKHPDQDLYIFNTGNVKRWRIGAKSDLTTEQFDSKGEYFILI